MQLIRLAENATGTQQRSILRVLAERADCGDGAAALYIHTLAG
jgi:hypothetical protein